jgi:hypothetical protein
MTVRRAVLVVALGTAINVVVLPEFYPFTLVVPALIVAAVSRRSGIGLGVLTATAAGAALLSTVALTVKDGLSVTGRLAPISANVAALAVLCLIGESLGGSPRQTIRR